MSREDKKFSLLLCGVPEIIKERIIPLFGEYLFDEIPDTAAFESLLENSSEKIYPLVICSSAIEGVSAPELAQSLRMQFPDSVLFYLSIEREGFQRKKFTKNGFTDAFIIPADYSYFKDKYDEILGQFANIETYRPVKVLDLHPGTKIDFDIALFMPMNKKYVKIARSGDEIDESRFKKLSDNHVTSLYVPTSQMESFHTYSANCLIELGKAGNNVMTETEKKEKMQSAVRELVTNIFNTTTKSATISEGKAILEDTKSIIDKFILGTEPDQWYEDLKKALGDSTDSYSHSSNVSTFAALFSIGLGIGKPEELAFAGLFHDLGISDLPIEIQEKDPTELNETELALYKKHPTMSVNLIKQRKLLVPPIVLTAVSQHHERWDGKGYPEGLREQKIVKEALILSFADEFDYMTRMKEGKKRFTPKDAVNQMKVDQRFSHDFLNQILKILPEENEDIAA